MNDEIKRIQGYIEARKKIPKEVLLEIMKTKDLETMGAIFNIFDSEEYENLIDQYPDMEDIIGFYVTFFRRCIIENIAGEYALNRYEAAGTLVNFYKGLKKDKRVPKRMIDTVKSMLKEVYMEGNEDIRECVINGFLEHIFEDVQIQADFSDWKNNEVLKEAYDQALKWANWQRGI